MNAQRRYLLHIHHPTHHLSLSLLLISWRGERVSYSLCLSPCRRPHHSLPPPRHPAFHQQHQQQPPLPSSPMSCAMPATATHRWPSTASTCCLQPASGISGERCSLTTPTLCVVATIPCSTCILPAAAMTIFPSTIALFALAIPSPPCWPERLQLTMTLCDSHHRRAAAASHCRRPR